MGARLDLLLRFLLLYCSFGLSSHDPLQTIRTQKLIDRDWVDILRQPAFVRMALVAAPLLGGHAMHDAFAERCWFSPAVSSVLWSESVAAGGGRLRSLWP
jgi:hypothetical protein